MTETNLDKPRRAKRRLAVPAIIAGGLSSMLLAFSLTPTFSALTAAITNDSNTAGTGSLVMQETGANSAGTQVTCTSGASGSATCSTINNFGGDNPTTSGFMTLKPGASTTTTIKIKNTGSLPASTFTVAGGAITRGTNGSVSGSATVAQLGNAFSIKIVTGSTTVFNDTATALAATASSPLTVPGSVAVNAEVTFTITTTLIASADATTQGLTITQPIIWTFDA